VVTRPTLNYPTNGYMHKDDVKGRD
jgi:hypothetical protein